MTTFNHAFDFAATVISNKHDATDVTPEMLIAAFRKRLDEIERDNDLEMLEACQRFDTYEVEQS
jgi:hypothetical protein